MIKLLLVFALFQQTNQQDSIQLINAPEIIEESKQLIAKEAYDSAISLLVKVHPADSNFTAVNYQLIRAFIKSGQTEKGDSVASYIKERGFPTSTFYIIYGNAYTNSGNPERGLSIYQEGLEAFPFDYTLNYNCGYAKSVQGKYQEAIAYIQRALDIRPFYSLGHQILGNLCARLGFRTKAMLSYATYLALDPDQNWALVRMNNLSNDAYRQEGTLVADGLDNSDFEFYDNLSRSRAAMDDRFKSEVEDFEAPVAQQFELLLRTLVYDESSEDFWMKFYVPAFTKLEEDGLTADFIYFILTSTGDQDVNGFLAKRSKEKDAWITILNKYISSNRLSHERTVQEESKVFSHWYRDDQSLYAIGNMNGEENVGPWTYYYYNGFKSAEGVYAEHGGKKGLWTYYHDNGRLKSKEWYDDDGLAQGDINTNSEDGILSKISPYKDDNLNGNWRSYYPCGQLQEVYPYVNNEGNGDGMVYYKIGNLKSKYKVVDSKLEGEYLSYHLNGEVSSKFNYSKDLREGPFARYYYNGQLSEKGTYENNLETGVFEFFYINGKLSSSGQYEDGKRSGEWKYYYSNGTLKTKENYNGNGDLDGSSYLYNLEGKLYTERIYKEGMIVGYKFFDQEEKVVEEKNDPSGNFEDYRFYYPTGELQSKGSTTNGKLNGPFETYHISGVVYQKGTMKDGSWHDAYEEYDEAGLLAFAYTNKDGEVHGYFRSFYDNGQVREEGWYIDGELEQRWIEYWMDGRKKRESYYVNGQLQGSVKSFGPKGRLFDENIYVDNEQVKIIQYDTLGNVYHTLDLTEELEKSTTKYVDGGNYFTSSYKCGELAEDIVFYYPDGSVFTEYGISNSQYHGDYINYDLYGNASAKGRYENNNQEGEWSYYYYNGEVKSRYSFIQDQRQGTTYNYYENGKLQSESSYLDDERHGAFTRYSPDGEIMFVKHYIKDKGPVSYQYKLADGSLSDSIAIASSGKFELKSYYPNGQVAAVQPYNDFYFEGELIYYDEQGNMLRKTNYKEGVRQGNSIYYFSNGNKKLVIPTYYGEEQGDVLEYYENGQLMESEAYVFGVRDGWRKLFDEEGKLVKKVFYWNGRIYSK